MNNFCFIINPISGIKRKQSIVATIDSVLGERGISYSLWFTTPKERGEALCKKAIEEGFSCVIAVGGDGTVHEIGKSLINTNVPLGIIPVGSGNGLARNLGIPLSLKKAVMNLINGSIAIIDTIKVNDEKYLGVAGVGFDAFVAKEFAKETTRGIKTYSKIVMREFKSFEPSHYEIRLNGEIINTSAFLITIANSAQYGNNAHIAPHAKMNDGLFDICIMEDFPTLQAPGLIARLFLRNIDESKYYRTVSSSQCIIKQNQSYVQLDGDVYNLGSELEFNINPKSLRVITPKKFLTTSSN